MDNFDDNLCGSLSFEVEGQFNPTYADIDSLNLLSSTLYSEPTQDPFVLGMPNNVEYDLQQSQPVSRPMTTSAEDMKSNSDQLDYKSTSTQPAQNTQFPRPERKVDSSVVHCHSSDNKEVQAQTSKPKFVVVTVNASLSSTTNPAYKFASNSNPTVATCINSNRYPSTLSHASAVVIPNYIDSSNFLNTSNSATATENNSSVETEAEEEPEVNLVVRNVVATFSTDVRLNLQRIAQRTWNVVYRRDKSMVSLKMRLPKATAQLRSSGKINVTGCTSEANAKVACRRVARKLQKVEPKVQFRSFQVVNVLATCSLPFGVNLWNFKKAYPIRSIYEPELHPALTYRYKVRDDKTCVIKIFTTGSVCVIAPDVGFAEEAISHTYSITYEHRTAKKSTKRPFEAQVKKYDPRQAFKRPRPASLRSRRCGGDGAKNSRYQIDEEAAGLFFDVEEEDEEDGDTELTQEEEVEFS